MNVPEQTSLFLSDWCLMCRPTPCCVQRTILRKRAVRASPDISGLPRGRLPHPTSDGTIHPDDSAVSRVSTPNEHKFRRSIKPPPPAPCRCDGDSEVQLQRAQSPTRAAKGVAREAAAEASTGRNPPPGWQRELQGRQPLRRAGDHNSFLQS